MKKIGILLINLGTPQSHRPLDVIRYLSEFLNDPRVVDLPWSFRTLLVNAFIIPNRFQKTAQAYQKIWLPEGSPLLVYTTALKEALSEKLGNDYQVEVGMRYGNPAIKTALQDLKACDTIKVIPLFPQYSSAATGSALAEVYRFFIKQWNIPSLSVQKDFHDHPAYIESYAALIQENIAQKKIDKIIFSYHGLPERHIDKTKNKLFCYQEQCFKTSELIATALSLNLKQYIVSFQSRLGKTPWIKPYTDLVLPELIKEGVKNIAIVCPSFVSDCLETLEEVNIQTRTQWQSLGGGEFTFIPCLNTYPRWVEELAEMIKAL